MHVAWAIHVIKQAFSPGPPCQNPPPSGIAGPIATASLLAPNLASIGGCRQAWCTSQVGVPGWITVASTFLIHGVGVFSLSSLLGQDLEGPAGMLATQHIHAPWKKRARMKGPRTKEFAHGPIILHCCHLGDEALLRTGGEVGNALARKLRLKDADLAMG